MVGYNVRGITSEFLTVRWLSRTFNRLLICSFSHDKTFGVIILFLKRAMVVE